MKKVKFEGKLNLNKETVSKLNDAQMESIKGGYLWTLFGPSCRSTCNACPPNTMQCPTVQGGCTDPVSTSTCATQ